MEKEKLVDLVTKAKAGDGTAADALFSEFYESVYNFAQSTVNDPDIACDITQESFLEVINTLDKLQEPAAFGAWLRRITYHQCTRYFKKTKEVQVDEDEEGNSVFDLLADESEDALPAEVYEKAEFQKTIGDMVDTLSPEQRAAVMLYYFDGLSVEKVAELQGVSAGTIKSRLNYARKSLKKSVEDYEKKNDVKLHSFALLPVLLYFLQGGGQTMPQAAVEATRAAIHTAVENMVAAGTAVAGGVATGGAAAATAGTTAASAGTTGVVGSLGAKIVAGVVAAALAAGGLTLALTGAKAEPKPKPGSYASETMEIYHQTDLLAENVDTYLGVNADFAFTKDGKCHKLDRRESTILWEAPEAESAQVINRVYNRVCYQDKEGAYHFPYDEELCTLSGLKGELKGLVSVFGDRVYAFSLDEEGLWGSVIDTETHEQKQTNLPVQVSGAEGILESRQIRDFQTIVGIQDKYFVQGDNGFLYGTGFSVTEEAGVIRLKLLAADNIPGSALGIDYGSINLPIYKDNATGQVIYQDVQVPMPEGYTEEKLEQCWCRTYVMMLFEDDSLYYWEKGWEVPLLQEELTALNEAGHVEKVFLTTYNEVIVWMDDDVLYLVKGMDKD